jgi:hypothetical protein
LESDRAYLTRTLIHDAGPKVAPPMKGIAWLNELYAAQPSDDRVLIDTNLTAYADFPAIPAPYYIMAESFAKRTWARTDGPVCLSLSGKRCSDEDMLAELIDRLHVGWILQKKGMPLHPEPADGRCFSSLDRSFLYSREDRFDVFVERWRRRGWVMREEFDDSVLYTFTPKCRDALTDWKRLHAAETQTSPETDPSG